MRKRFFGRGADASDGGKDDLPEDSTAAFVNPALEDENLDASEAAQSDSLGPVDPESAEEEDSEEWPEDAGEEATEEAEETEDVLAKLRAEAEENYDKYVRAVAELENYKKRTLKERSELIKYAGEYLARDILDVVDNLERALSHADADNPEEVIKGVKMVRDQLVSALERHNIVGFSGLGEPFDPNMQEAMTAVPTADLPPGMVMNEFRKAYFFKDKLIRPAQVVVSAAMPAPAEESAEESDTKGSENE